MLKNLEGVYFKNKRFYVYQKKLAEITFLLLFSFELKRLTNFSLYFFCLKLCNTIFLEKK